MVLTPEDMELLKTGPEAFFSALLHPISAFLEKISGPFATEVGAAFGDKAKLYRLKNAVHCIKKAKVMLEEAGIDPGQVEPKILLPLLEHASLEDGEELQDRWAALLANAANPSSDTGLSPAFIDVLRQLSPHEAAFLDLLCPSPTVKEKELVFSPGSPFYSDLIKEWQQATGGMNPDRIPFTLDNFVRLGIFRIITRPSSMGVGEVSISDLPQQQPIQSVIWDDQYAFTDFGRKFLIACRKPQPEIS